MNELSFKSYHGSGIEAIIPLLGALRISVFFDFPYLYEGDLQYEQEYLKSYTKDPDSIVYAVFDGDMLVGATTGSSLEFVSAELQQPLLDSGMNLNKIFYFGESILLEEYRGSGLGNKFFDIRERHALKLGFEQTTFCSVVRPDDHPLKPINYRPNDAFWMKRGYSKQDFSCQMSWLDRNEAKETKKLLQFWMKKWK